MSFFRLVAIVGAVMFHAVLGTQTADAGPDPRLLPLILPTSQVIAGMTAPHGRAQPSSLLLMTRNNVEDLNDFLALTGVDNSRSIHQVVFTAGSGSSGALTEHSLLASGNFDQGHVFKAAIGGGADETEYNGIPVLVVQRLNRDHSGATEVRWLAFPVSSIAILGSVSTVQLELDRQSAGMKADAAVLKRLNDLGSDVDAWCMLVAFAKSGEIVQALDSIDHELTRLIQDGDGFQFGVHYGERVRIEYLITSAAGASAEEIGRALDRSLLGDDSGGASVSHFRGREVEGAARRTIQISQERYQTWIAGVSARRRAQAGSVR